MGIFPSKFNYSKKLPLIDIIIPLSFCKNKRIKKDKVLNSSFFFLLGGERFCIII
jgi:hypothetical protein